MLFRFIFSALMSCMMSFLMTGFISWMNLGFNPNYFQQWQKSFVIAWPTAFVIVITFVPILQSISHAITKRVNHLFLQKSL